MVFLFMAMPMLPLVHSHAQATDYSQALDGKPAIEKYAEQCKLCDFLTHKQGKEMQLANPIVLVVPIIQPVKIRTNLISGNYTFTLQGFTNKGPPVPIHS